MRARDAIDISSPRLLDLSVSLRLGVALRRVAPRRTFPDGFGVRCSFTRPRSRFGRTRRRRSRSSEPSLGMQPGRAPRRQHRPPLGPWTCRSSTKLHMLAASALRAASSRNFAEQALASRCNQLVQSLHERNLQRITLPVSTQAITARKALLNSRSTGTAQLAPSCLASPCCYVSR